MDNTREALLKFVKAKGIPWPQLFFEGKGDQGWTNPLVCKYGITVIPSTILVDRSGKVAEVGVRGAALEPAVGRLLGNGSPPK